MASSFSTALKLEKMTTGEKAGLWGTTTNTNLDLIEQAIGGYVELSLASGDQTPGISDGSASDGRNKVIKLTGSMTANRTLTVPAVEKTYLIIDGTTRTDNDYTITIKASGQSGGIAMPVGAKMLVFVDGTNANRGILEKGYITTTSAYLAVDGDQILVDTSSSTVTVTLPASPSVGSEVHFIDSKENFGSNKLVIAQSTDSQPIEGDSADKKATTNGDAFTLVYANSTKGWVQKHTSVTLTNN